MCFDLKSTGMKMAGSLKLLFNITYPLGMCKKIKVLYTCEMVIVRVDAQPFTDECLANITTYLCLHEKPTKNSVERLAVAPLFSVLALI